MMRRMIRTGMLGGNRVVALPFSDAFVSRLSKWQGAGFAVAGGVATVSPTIGPTELIVNPGAEGTYSSGLAPNWQAIANTGSKAESADVHGGSSAQSVVATAAQREYIGPNNGVVTVGVWYQGSVWGKLNSGTCRIYLRPAGGVGLNILTPGTLGSYVKYSLTGRATDTGLTIAADCNGPVYGAGNILLDDASVMAVSLPTAFATVRAPAADVTVQVKITRIAGTHSGIVVNLDSVANPLNFIIAYLDGRGNCVLDECVNGVYANKATGVVTYGANKILKVVRSGTLCQVFYDGAQVGTDQTMTANTNRNHGIVSMYSGNTFDDFSLTNP